MNVTRIPHLDGDPGVAQTIRQMRRLITQGKQDPAVHELAAQILTKARVSAFDWAGEARAIYEAVRRNVRFTRDVYGNETLHAAPDIIRLKIGDCDDFTILICSLLQSIGQECRIVTIATGRGEDAEDFVHVYPEALINGRWTALDAARQHPAFGKSPEQFTRKRAWSIDTEEYTDMAGYVQSIAPRGQGPIGAWSGKVFPPFRLTPNGGTYLSAQPTPPRSQRFIRPPVGSGNYGARVGRRMGIGQVDDGGDPFTSGENAFLDSSTPLSPAQISQLQLTNQQTSGALNPFYGITSGVTPTLPSSSSNPNLITNAIVAGETGAANIIAASRANPYNLFPTTSYQQPSSVNPALVNSSLLTNPLGGSIFGIPLSTLLLLGGGLFAVSEFGGKR